MLALTALVISAWKLVFPGPGDLSHQLDKVAKEYSSDHSSVVSQIRFDSRGTGKDAYVFEARKRFRELRALTDSEYGAAASEEVGVYEWTNEELGRRVDFRLRPMAKGWATRFVPLEVADYFGDGSEQVLAEFTPMSGSYQIAYPVLLYFDNSSQKYVIRPALRDRPRIPRRMLKTAQARFTARDYERAHRFRSVSGKTSVRAYPSQRNFIVTLPKRRVLIVGYQANGISYADVSEYVINAVKFDEEFGAYPCFWGGKRSSLVSYAPSPAPHGKAALQESLEKFATARSLSC